MIPAGIITMQGNIIPPATLSPVTAWNLGSDFRLINTNTIEYFQGDGSIGVSNQYAKPLTPFEFQWEALPNPTGAGVNIFLSTELSGSPRNHYLGFWISGSTSRINVWYSTTAGNEAEHATGVTTNILLRYRGDGTTIFREYSIDNGTTWIEVGASYRISQNSNYRFVVEMYDYVSSKIGNTANNLLQKGLFTD